LFSHLYFGDRRRYCIRALNHIAYGNGFLSLVGFLRTIAFTVGQLLLTCV
jgi:hypothetical protein